MNKNRPLLRLEGVSAGYEGRTILTNVDLTVYENDFLGIIGPNGGGKTTLVKLMLGLIRPYSGRMVYLRNGEPCREEPRIGYLPQYNKLDKRFPLSVRDVVLSGLNREKPLWRPFSAEHHRKVDRMLSFLDMDGLADKPIGALSGGQLQRALLGRAVVAEPELLLLDEPGTYLDKPTETKLYSLIEQLNRRCAVVLVSHDIGTVLQKVKNIACVDGTLHYHPAAEVSTAEVERLMGCPFQLLAHGDLPHRVLGEHHHSHPHGETPSHQS